MAVAGLKAAFRKPALTDEEALDLVMRAQAGDEEARNTVMLRNVRLASHMTSTFRLPPGLDRSDLFQEAELALINAITRFEPERGVPFRAWASTTIRFYLWKRVQKQRRWIRAHPYLDSRSENFIELGFPPERSAREELAVLCRAALANDLVEQKHVDMVMARATGATQKEISEKLGVNRKTVSRRLNFAIRAFQELLHVD